MNQLTVTAENTRANLELARAFADSKMVADHFKKSVGDCYIAINLAHRYGMDPWTLMQEMYIISGKPMMSGKLATAILNNSLADPLRPTYAGEGDERAITLSGRPENETAPLSVTLKVKDAKTANEQWKRNPDQMLMYAAARMWGRRYAPDILLGILFDDEEITSAATPLPDKPRTAIAAPARGDIIDRLTGEVFDAPRTMPKTSDKWHDWAAQLVSAIRASPDIDTVDKWLAANSETLGDCLKEAPKVHGNFEAAVKTYKLDLLNREDGT